MILMIDDEPRGISSYKEELEFSGYPVVYHRKVDEALKALDEGRQEVELVILDIMMPPGQTFANDEGAQRGLRTGVRVYDVLREWLPDCPVIILTHVTDPRVVQRFRGEKRCWYLQKTDYLPFQLAEVVADVLK